ncbi:uncharacterized protein [Lepeophtheirus salmonis]|uniref:uncharacterized protein n=1 Tax=Lepeophtheirus salmonis TaxID=72036 RepID=UPI001AE19BB9|nr:uncharacterized protein LOC121124134 [Lepeophtheirus salmonis]
MQASGPKALVIKLIFEYQGERSNSPKIRKLVLEEGETPTLGFLCESFSLKSSQTFYYYDDDGDQITISNDRELLTAIKEKKSSDTLRLYTGTELIPGDIPSRRNHEKDIFEEICTNCQNRIGRFSYKCVICSGVDLCGRCEAFGVHSTHDIIRLSNEKTYPSQFFMRLHRLYDKMNQTQSMISLHPLSSPPPQSSSTLLPQLGTIPSSLSPESLSKTHEEFDLIDSTSAPLTVKQLSLSEESLNSEPKAKSLSPAKEQEAFNPSETPYRGVLQAPVTVLLKDEFQVHEAREANSEEIVGSLRGLRKEIDKLLIDEEDRKSTPESSSSKCTLAKMDSSGNNSTCPYDLIKVLSFEESGEEFPSDKLELKPCSEEDSETRETPALENGNVIDQEDKDKPNHGKTESSSYSMIPLEEETQKVSHKPTKTSYDYVPAYCPRTRNLLNESSVYSLKYNQSPYLTTTQKVSDSLEQMKAMGFSDDDGWLTQLLTMERGDIDKVLDILTPVNK